MINRYHVNNELSAISMCQGTFDIKCITYKYQSCLTHANTIIVEALETAATNPGLETDYLMPPIDSAQKRSIRNSVSFLLSCRKMIID